ncbi:phage tail tube protein [Notoacmeibacter sp. MSK16QG-6]|uniref:phage tail tube protein n=1 Tax=Notoacmeibacter sp. MSK16QG-6 TaxID=2957982 RepID=UPI00209FB4EA|nr:phage tail tube protein [Notoacmeibacter sp. MSK16QG-6]MCP1200055.1 phage tail tube protein [Notoacmeibacter sp. MSK16QG-6]
MPFAPTSGARFGYVAEATFGTTPATPTFLPIRATGAGLRTNKSTVVSEEIRYDRNISDEPQTGQDVSGAYNFELSYGSFDDLIAAALFGSWTNDVVKNGITDTSFTIEETLRVDGALDTFSRFTGAMINQMSLSVTARERVTGSFDMMAQKEELASAIITGATYTDPSTEPILTASSHVADLTVAGDAAIKVRSLSLQIANNLRTRPVVGSLYSEQFGWSDCDVTGTIEAYFQSNALHQQVLNHGGGALSFTIGSEANKKYAFSLPKIIFLNGERRLGGKNDDVMMSIPFRAVYDDTLAASVGITRAVA